MTFKKVNLITTSVITVLYLIAAVGIGMVAPLSVMAFDAPDSVNMIEPWVFVLSMLTWPIMFLLSIILSWIFYKYRKHTISLMILLLPLINLLALIILFSHMSFGP